MPRGFRSEDRNFYNDESRAFRYYSDEEYKDALDFMMTSDDKEKEVFEVYGFKVDFS